MPRLSQKSVEYAAQDFQKEVQHCLVDSGFNQKDLSRRCKISASTLSRRLSAPADFTVDELQRIVDVLRPDPMIVLSLLGYSKKEVRMAFEVSINK